MCFWHRICSNFVITPEKAVATHSSTLAWKNPMDGGAGPWAAVHGVAMSWTQLSDFTITFYLHALEKEMAPHSTVLAWSIPGTGAWWAAVYAVAQRRTRLKRLSSSSKEVRNRTRKKYPVYIQNKTVKQLEMNVTKQIRIIWRKDHDIFEWYRIRSEQLKTHFTVWHGKIYHKDVRCPKINIYIWCNSKQHSNNHVFQTE